MKRSTDRILTTHTGSLPRTEAVLAMLQQAVQGTAPSPDEFEAAVRDGVTEVVRRQVQAGLDVVNDGEMSKYSFNSYHTDRLSGFSIKEIPVPADAPPARGPIGLEAEEYPEFFERWAFNAGTRAVRAAGLPGRAIASRVCTEPVAYTGTAALERDIKNVLAAAEGTAATEVFMSALPPSGMGQGFGGNEYYPTQDDFDEAISEAMRVEYEAIVGAGIILQFDCNWGVLSRVIPGSTDDIRKIISHSIALMNHATRNIDPDKMRIHLCWGADEAPHHKDLPLEAIVDLMLTARPNGLGVVASNGRHEWEWRIWRDVRVPDGKVIIPGVVDSTTNIIEHPESVAERIRRFADVLGKENILAGVDCGFDTIAGSAQVVPRIAWAKLEALVEGARLATDGLF